MHKLDENTQVPKGRGQGMQLTLIDARFLLTTTSDCCNLSVSLINHSALLLKRASVMMIVDGMFQVHP